MTIAQQQSRISPFLWFDGKAEEAANFYVSLFPNSNIEKVTRYSEAGPAPAGTVMTVSFSLDGREFVALNGGPHFQFTPAISFAIYCDDQAEVDRLWDELRDGGETMPCGWVTDRFGVTWQVVPRELIERFANGEEKKVVSMTKAMFEMEKLELAPLLAAYDAG
jgi:predicted 3-demethylubiquinone-9 3-methyltransferase (glyoxalase superfamily)